MTKDNLKAELAFFELENWEQDYLKKRLAGFKLRFFSQPIEEVEKKQKK